tara:strand:+ start:1992 stop:2369 length:378 start_codon:yes stop_codon:yes gene_type:complete
MSPFTFLNEINFGKKDIIVDDITEKQYNSFMINRGLSYFKDTAVIANEMNINHHLDNRLQFDFLINMIRKKRRFSKWNKPQIIDDLDVIKEYYGYSNKQAKAVHNLLSSEQIGELRKKVYKGGKK